MKHPNEATNTGLEARKALGAALKQRRLQMRKRQTAVAKAIGTTQQFVSLVEAGGTGVSDERLRALANELGIELSDLQAEAEAA